MKFYDRKKEQIALKSIEEKSSSFAQMTVITGRRRIGKTALIRHSFTNIPFLYFFVARKSEALLCEELSDIIREVLHEDLGDFTSFARLLGAIMHLSKRRNFTLVLDEFQNIKYANEVLFSDIQNIWDANKDESRLNLVLCGSVYSMMAKIFDDSKEPLYGRATNRIQLKPFSIVTLKEILSDGNPNYTPDDLLTLYMLTGGVAKYVEQLIMDGAFTHEAMIRRNGVVDVEQGDDVLADARADVLGQASVDVDLAAHRDAAARQTGVDVAGHEAELRLEGRPALARDGDVFAAALVRFDPVEEGELILRELFEDLGLLVALAELRLHVGHDFGDAGVAGVLVEGLEEVELGVFLDLHAHVVELLDRGVAGEEVHRSRAEGDDLEVLQSDEGARHGQELVDQVSAVSGVADRIFRDVRLHAAELEVVAGVEHAAERVATVTHETVAGFLAGRAEHDGTVEVLGEHGLGDLRAEVAEVDAEGVAFVLLEVLEGLEHVDLALDDADGTFIDVALAVLRLIGVDESAAAVDGEGFREAVAGDGHDAELDGGGIFHGILLFS